LEFAKQLRSPLLAQWNTLTLYPLSAIYLVLPLPWSLSIFCLGHLFLAGFGMYVLAHSYTNDRFAAAVAGFGFAFNGLALNCLMWPNNIAALGWMPWVIWAVGQGWQRGGRAILLAAFVGSMQMLSGAPEIILFTWVIVGGLWLSTLLGGTVSKASLFGRLVLMVVLIGAISAVQLLPFLDLLAHSERDNEFGRGTWAMPKWGWLNLVVPLFKCRQSGTGPCFQPNQFWTSSYYPGISVLILALFSGRFVPQRKVTLFWGVTLLALLLSLGDDCFFYAALHKLIPASGFMRFPIKFVILATFALPLLAAFAIPRLRVQASDSAVPAKPVIRWLLIIGAIFAALITGCTAYSMLHPFGDLPSRTMLLNGAMRIVSLALFLGILFCLRRSLKPGVRTALQSAFLFSIAIDAWTHAPNQNPTVAPEIYAPRVVARELNVPPTDEISRAFINRPTSTTFFRSLLHDPAKDFIGKRFGLLGNCNLLEGVPTTDGFYSLYLPKQRELWTQLWFSTNFPSGLADFLGIARISTNVFEWQARTSALPILTIGASPVYADPATTMSRLFDPSFNASSAVYLPVESRLTINCTNDATARIIRKNISNSQITATTECSTGAILSVAQSDYHRWKAYVDGKPAKIWRANYAFQAVEVPPGRREVKLVYEDPPLVYGGVISGSTLFACLIACYWKRRLGRDEEVGT